MEPLTKNEGDIYIMTWIDIHNYYEQRMLLIFFTLYTLAFFHC